MSASTTSSSFVRAAICGHSVNAPTDANSTIPTHCPVCRRHHDTEEQVSVTCRVHDTLLEAGYRESGNRSRRLAYRTTRKAYDRARMVHANAAMDLDRLHARAAPAAPAAPASTPSSSSSSRRVSFDHVVGLWVGHWGDNPKAQAPYRSVGVLRAAATAAAANDDFAVAAGPASSSLGVDSEGGPVMNIQGTSSGAIPIDPALLRGTSGSSSSASSSGPAAPPSPPSVLGKRKRALSDVGRSATELKTRALAPGTDDPSAGLVDAAAGRSTFSRRAALGNLARERLTELHSTPVASRLAGLADPAALTAGEVGVLLAEYQRVVRAVRTCFRPPGADG